MQHADRLIARIIFLEGHPNLQKLDPMRIGQTLRETLECDLAGDCVSRSLFDKLGEEKYGMLTARPAPKFPIETVGNSDHAKRREV